MLLGCCRGYLSLGIEWQNSTTGYCCWLEILSLFLIESNESILVILIYRATCYFSVQTVLKICQNLFLSERKYYQYSLGDLKYTLRDLCVVCVCVLMHAAKENFVFYIFQLLMPYGLKTLLVDLKTLGSDLLCTASDLKASLGDLSLFGLFLAVFYQGNTLEMYFLTHLLDLKCLDSYPPCLTILK